MGLHWCQTTDSAPICFPMSRRTATSKKYELRSAVHFQPPNDRRNNGNRTSSRLWAHWYLWLTVLVQSPIFSTFFQSQSFVRNMKRSILNTSSARPLFNACAIRLLPIWFYDVCDRLIQLQQISSLPACHRNCDGDEWVKRSAVAFVLISIRFGWVAWCVCVGKPNGGGIPTKHDGTQYMELLINGAMETEALGFTE